MSDLYDYPALYDALLPVKAYGPFYVDLARRQGGPVLELACGTGAITVPVALRGLPTVGLDSSHAMLTAARQRASAAGAPVAFVQGDIRDFALDRRFDLVFAARNSLLHLLSASDLVAAFTAARRHLTPRGLFAFDIFNPDPRGWRGCAASVIRSWRWIPRSSARCEWRRLTTSIRSAR